MSSCLHFFAASLLQFFTTSPLQFFTSALLYFFAVSLLQRFTPSPLHSFTSLLLDFFTSSLLRFFTSSRLRSFTSCLRDAWGMIPVLLMEEILHHLSFNVFAGPCIHTPLAPDINVELRRGWCRISAIQQLFVFSCLSSMLKSGSKGSTSRVFKSGAGFRPSTDWQLMFLWFVHLSVVRRQIGSRWCSWFARASDECRLSTDG